MTWCHRRLPGSAPARARARVPPLGPGSGRSRGRSEGRAERGADGARGGRARERLRQHLPRPRLPETWGQTSESTAWRTDVRRSPSGRGRRREARALQSTACLARSPPLSSAQTAWASELAGGCGSRSLPAGLRAALPGPPAPWPRAPLLSASKQRCARTPKSGIRGKCLHEPRGCPGSTTRVLKSVVASNTSFSASMSYSG